MQSVMWPTTSPTTRHWTAVKQIMRYLKGTTNLGLVYTPQNNNNCGGFSDSDWAGTLTTRNPHPVMCSRLVVVSWRSKKQTSVALSTAEVEYVALASATQEALWMRQLTAELNGKLLTEAIVIFEDYQSAVAMTKNPQFHGHSKHIAIKYHFIREGIVKIQYCPSTEIIADMLMKALPKDVFAKL